ncbi:hypothetical protein [Kitasatospora cineracea]|uniref:hypothetical protein n=1 Tax=Kitasatospora cineracea TaxID=88074 RepID=UPI0037FED069
MRYTINHRWGDAEEADSLGGPVLVALLAELADPTDIEHPDVWIDDNESGWCLSVFAGDAGLVVLENDEKDDIRHLRGLSSDDAIALCTAFGAGDLEAVLQKGWLPGYG